jgi:hypothetical protein
LATEVDRKPILKGNQTFVQVKFQAWRKFGTIQREMQKYSKIDPLALQVTRQTISGLKKQRDALRENAEILYALAAIKETLALALVPIAVNPLASPVGQGMATIGFLVNGVMGGVLEAEAAAEEKTANQLDAKAASLQKAIAGSDLPKIYWESATGNTRKVMGQAEPIRRFEIIEKLVPDGANWQDYQVPPPPEQSGNTPLP